VSEHTPTAVDSSTTSRHPTATRGRRIVRIALWSGGALLVVLGAVVALLPTILGSGMVRHAVAGAIGDRVNGTVALQELRVGWSGPMGVRGLVIDDPAGGTRISADVSVDQGLWALITRGVAELDVRVSGSLRSARMDDGTFGIGRLAKEPEVATPPAAAAAKDAAPGASDAIARIPDGLRRARLSLDGITVELTDARGAVEWAVRDVKGELAAERGADLSLTVVGNTEMAGERGTVDVSATLNRMVGADGALRLRGAGAQVRARVTEAPVAASGMAMRIAQLRADVRSEDLTGRIQADIEAEASIDGEPGAAVRAALVFDRLLAADGTPVIDLAAIHGSFEAKSVPTRPFERFVAGTGLELARDVGPRIDVAATFADAVGGQIELSARGSAISISAQGGVDPTTRVAALRSVSLDGTLAPALLESVAQFTVAAPARLSLRATDVVVPASGADGGFPLNQLRFAADVALALDGLQVPGPGGPVPLDVASLRAALRADPVGSGIAFDVTATPARPAGDAAGIAPAPGGFRAAGTLAPGGAWGIHGTASVTDLPSALVQPFVPRDLPLSLAEDIGPTVRTIEVSIDDGESRGIGIRVDAPNVAVAATGRVEAGAWRLDAPATVSVRAIRPALLANWGVHVDAPLSARVRVAKLTVPAEGAFDPSRTGVDVHAECGPVDGRVVGVRPGAEAAAPVAWLHGASVDVRSEAIGTEAIAELALRAAAGPTEPASAVAGTLRATGIGDASAKALESARLALAVRAPAVPNSLVTAFLPAAADPLKAMGATTHAAELSYDGTVMDGALKATVTGDAGDRVFVEATVAPQAVTATVHVAADITPALMAHFTGEAGPALRSPAALEVRSGPVVLPRTGTWVLGMPSTAALTARVPAMTVGGLAPGVGDLAIGDAVAKADVALHPDARVARAEVTLDATLAAVRSGGTPVPVAPLAARASWMAGKGDAPADWTAAVTMQGVSGDGLGALLALDEAARREIGAGARVRAEARGASGGIAFEAESTLERMRVRAAGTLRDGVVELADSTATLELSPAQALAMLNDLRAPVGEDGKPRPPMWKEVSAVTVSADVRSLRMRTDGLVGMAARLDARVGPVRLVPADGAPIQVDGVDVAVDAPSTEAPTAIRVRSSVTEGGKKLPLALDGTVAGWLGADGKPSADRIRLDATLKAERASTRVLGALMGLGSDLELAMGPEVTVDAVVQSPAPGSADGTASVTSKNLSVRVPSVTLRDGMVRIAPQKPAVAEFIPTPPVRQHWLGSLNPVLRDIRLKDERQPIRLELTSLGWPLDGDRAKLSGDARLTVGPVLFERTVKNESLDFLNVFRASSPAPVEGIVSPLVVAVRKGQLKYADFEIGIDPQGNAWKTRLVFDGDIDLVATPPYARAITANYPLGSVAREAIGKLPSDEGTPLANALSALTLGAGDALMVGVKFSGPLGTVDGRTVPLKVTANLKLDGKALEKGVQQAGQKAIEALGQGLGDLLNKPRKK